ncbi:MAG: histidine kinase, partial [Coriobacteriales bacterium]|nr:histidine kinase [Coriobacteriales bacterium]
MSNRSQLEEVYNGRTLSRQRRWISIFVTAILLAGFAAGGIIGYLRDINQLFAVGAIGIAFCAFLLGLFANREDKLRADQTKLVLNIAREMAGFLRNGLNEETALEACRYLLPVTDAASVAIYYKGECIGHAGADAIWEEYGGDPVPIPWAKKMFDYGATCVVRSDDEEPLPTPLKACATALINVSRSNDNDVDLGTLKLYYRRRRDIGETQQAMVIGFAALISVQLVQRELARQTEIATNMELRALQAQINPHFLFNTINTIASLIRTDPMKARDLLREFAVFYRRTLESSQDNITIELELAQTLRYLRFEIARFGAERIHWDSRIEPGLEKIVVPAFIIQPLVENSVGHAMRDTGEPLHIFVDVRSSGENDVIIDVSDDGVGMDASKVSVAMKSDGSRGAGIAIKNVDERMKSCFGPGSGLKISSELGVGTTVTLTLVDAKKRQAGEEGNR